MESLKRKIPTCEVCDKPANQTCGGCKIVFYCTKAHQKIGWREGHKFKCRAFKIQYSDTFGRHMVATRNIQPGEMILKEKPAVVGPRISSPAQCLACAKKLEPIKFDDKYDFYKCSSCYWPMCGKECEKAEIHKDECNVMTKRKYKCTIKYEEPHKPEAAYCVIAPLRVLLMKNSNPEQYENIICLESHIEDRRNTKLYLILKANLVTFITQVLGLPFDEDTILKVASIFDVNSYDVRSPDGIKRFRAVYVTASMLNHSCKPNTRHVFLDDDYNFALIATVPIAKGEPITATYTQTLLNTLDRRRLLLTNKCFECECERCKDPTEFGTYFGSIYCSVCNRPDTEFGISRKAMMVSVNPLDESSQWKCEKCGHMILSKQILWGNNALKTDLNKLDKTKPNEFEDFILMHSQILHPSNHLMIQAKLALSKIYGNYKGYNLSELPDRLLQRKIDLCHELLEVMDKLEPGWSRIRGTILLDLQATMAVQGKRDFEAQKLTKQGFQAPSDERKQRAVSDLNVVVGRLPMKIVVNALSRLMESLALLQEAAEILRVEPYMNNIIENKILELDRELATVDDGCLTL